MPLKESELHIDFDTIKTMIKIYCRKVHNEKDNLCKSCNDLLIYSKKRLENCQHGDKKPPCRNCTTHCYNKKNRDQIRKIMRFSGPRMIWHHPQKAINHLLKKNKLD